MLEPEYLAGISDEFIELYAQVERDITADIARRIAKTNYFTETAKWQLERANEIGMLQKDVEKILSEATGLSKPAIRKLMSEAGYKALAADDEIYSKIGLDKVIDFTKSDTMKAILLQGTKNTYQVLKNFTNITAETARKALENALDRAYLQVISGAFTREQAIKAAVNDLAKQGITKIAYPSGSTIGVEAGIRRAVTTGINQTVAQLQLARAGELGCNHVETSSHSGARPSHAVWQGQVFSLTKDGKYPDFYQTTGYGSGDGLCGWNCYHNFFPFLEGVSTPAFAQDPSAMLGKSNEQAYEESQKQRYYERKVREAKKRVAAYEAAAKAATTPEEKGFFEEKLQESKKLVRKRQKSLRDYCKATGRDQEYSRTYVVGYNKPYTIGSD